jgi:hypothetical protein
MLIMEVSFKETFTKSKAIQTLRGLENEFCGAAQPVNTIL